MTRTELEQWAVRHGYTKDRHGHFTKTVTRTNPKDSSRYRLHISQNAARKEVRVGSRWIRMRSAYLKSLSLDKNDKLCGLKAEGCRIQDAPKPAEKPYSPFDDPPKFHQSIAGA